MCWTLIDDVSLVMMGDPKSLVEWRSVKAIVEEAVNRSDTKVIRLLGPYTEAEVRKVLGYLEEDGKVVSMVPETGIERLWKTANVVEQLAAIECSPSQQSTTSA